MPLRLSGDAKLEINELVISNSSSVSLPANTAIGNVDSTEIGYLDNVTDPIQTQLNTKANSASVQVQLDLKSNISSPEFTGIPIAPTAVSGTNTTQIATTAYSFEAASSASANANTRALSYANSASAHAVVVSNQHTDSSIGSASGIIISNIVASAPETLDTLNELAAALGNDANFSTTVTNNIATKLSIASASSTYATFAYANSASANAAQVALGYANSASANVNTRALGYANSASAHVSSIIQIQLNNKEKSIPLQSSAPTSPESSDLWVDSLSMQLKVYNGTSWVALGAAVDDSQLIIAQRMFI